MDISKINAEAFEGYKKYRFTCDSVAGEEFQVDRAIYNATKNLLSRICEDLEKILSNDISDESTITDLEWYIDELKGNRLGRS